MSLCKIDFIFFGLIFSTFWGKKSNKNLEKNKNFCVKYIFFPEKNCPFLKIRNFDLKKRDVSEADNFWHVVFKSQQMNPKMTLLWYVLQLVAFERFATNNSKEGAHR